MKIVHISDNHRAYPTDLPQGDILCHTGDYSLLSKHSHTKKRIGELKDLENYFAYLKGAYHQIVFTPGNHDWIFETDELLAREILKSAIVLMDEPATIGGVKFYGTPSQPPFANWAFNHDSELRAHKYKNIPDDTEVLLTHCPPYGILDCVGDYGWEAKQHVGCPLLSDRIEKLENLKAHLFGHIHEDAGIIKLGNITYSNGSLMDEYYKNVNKANVLEI